MLMSRYKKAGQMHSINIANSSFEDVAKFKYLGTTLTDQSCMHEEIKSKLNSGNACHYLVQSLLSFHLLPMNVEIKVNKSISLPVVLNECETLSLTLREVHKLRVFENRVLTRYLDLRGMKKQENVGRWIMRSFIYPNIVRQINSGE
jgi:hypothetical protein